MWPLADDVGGVTLQCTGSACHGTNAGNCGGPGADCGELISSHGDTGRCSCAGCAGCNEPPAVLRRSPVYFNYSQILLPAAIGVQAECAAVTHGAAANSSGVQPPAGSINCSELLGACLEDMGCKSCFHILQGVSSGAMPVATALSNATCNDSDNATGRVLAALTSPASCVDRALRAAASSENDTLLLRTAWRCARSLPTGRQCIADMGQSIVADDVSDRSWFALWRTASCQALITGVALNLAAVMAKAAPWTACSHTMARMYEYHVMPPLAHCEVAAQACVETPHCKPCLVGEPTAQSVDIQYTTRCEHTLTWIKQACHGLSYANFLKCHDAITTNNSLVYFTAFFGVLSLFGSIAVLAVIHGHRKDLRSLRERILVGVFFSNALYSLANTIPVGLESTEPESCGSPVLGAKAVAHVRGMWFWAKYTMVLYEIFVIYASIVALRSGSVNMPPQHERRAHVACMASGLTIFIAFSLTADEQYRQYHDATTYVAQQSALNEYDAVVRQL